MKRRTKLITLMFIFGAFISGVVGCGAKAGQNKPYTEKINTIMSDSKALSNEPNVTKKLTDLAKLEKEYQVYQSKKKKYPQVQTAYRKAIKEGKQEFKKKNQNISKLNTPTDPKKETQKSLEQKIANLKALVTQVSAELNTVYSQKEVETLTVEINKQIALCQEQIKTVILSTDDSQKYMDAYANFTEKGNSFIGQRGISNLPTGFLETVGLTKDEYVQLWGGIFDYYGNSVNQSFISQDQSRTATKEALNKLTTGKYARHVINIHTINFYQIGIGNYSGLIGTWREVAVMFNRHDGKGNAWGQSSGDRLSVTKYHISDSKMTLRGSSEGPQISADGSTAKATFNQSDHLNIAAEVGSQFWSVDFYPKDIVIPEDNQPSSINSAKERIVIRTSNNSYTEVFQRE